MPDPADTNRVTVNELQKATEELYKQNFELATLYKKVEQLNGDLEVANSKLKDLDKLKTEFLSLASHQLRAPLTAIKGYASMLEEEAYGKLTTEQAGAIKRIYVSAQGLSSLVEDLLNISKIEQGGLKFEFEETDLGKLLTDLYNEIRITAEDKGLEFTIDIPSNQSFMAHVDRLKLKQAFLNLADNSIKYTPHGFVKLSLRREGNTIVYQVADNGIGISPETKAKLFDKFSRGEGGRLNTGGSGLGLYLAKQIILAHKGDIAIESDGVGKGSKFTVTIPSM
ncbi:MAG TPA: HAMP domain-containing sensor histidine kinase [Candidatus Paceibacterota bacterium]|nr:HAMP domain-containing sensor histidine kinase [Candidatus Paceibacterota bacterium]